MADEEKNEQQEETQAEGAQGRERSPRPRRLRPRRPLPRSPGRGGSLPRRPRRGGPSRRGPCRCRRPEGPDDELEGLDWKARRRLERSREPGERGPQQSPEERAAARREARKLAAPRRVRLPDQEAPPGRRGRHRHPARRAPLRRAQGQRRDGRLEQARQDDHRPDRGRPAPSAVREDRPPSRAPCTPTTRTTRPGEGDLVRVVETRPLSRTKRWRLVEILEKAKPSRPARDPARGVEA